MMRPFATPPALKCWTYEISSASPPAMASSPEAPCRKSSSQPPKMTSSELLASNSGASMSKWPTLLVRPRLYGVMSTCLVIVPGTLIVACWTWPGV